MHAKLLSRIWIMLGSIYYMSYITLYGVTLSFFNKLTRDRADNILHWWSKKILSLLNVKYKLVNPHHIIFEKDKRYVLMVNHSSLYDIPLTYATIPGTIRMVAKKELGKIPLFGTALRAAEVPIIDRSNRKQSIQALDYAKQKMNHGVIIWICPEGTRSNDGKLLPFKKGGFIMAIEANAFIIPVGIRGAHHILPKKTWQFHLNQEVEVHLGQAIDASKYSIEEKDKLIEIVRNQMLILKGESPTA
jgi:1-acyl-sn-glycerol-3-phosphate acyltransferase